MDILGFEFEMGVFPNVLDEARARRRAALVVAEVPGAAGVWREIAPVEADTGMDERCALLAQIWTHVPQVWEEGLLVTRAPPADHECAGEGG